MKRHGVLNAPLSGLLARLGHTDLVVVADCGLPVPAHVPVVDLAVTLGLPAFLPVLDALLADTVVEGWTVAEEARTANPAVWAALAERLPGEPDVVPHADLKVLTGRAAFVVRTGEATPYANVVLRSGVPF